MKRPPREAPRGGPAAPRPCLQVSPSGFVVPLPSEYGTYETVNAIFSPWRSDAPLLAGVAFRVCGPTAGRIWHLSDSQCHIIALAFRCASDFGCRVSGLGLMSSELGTYKTVKARLWPWRSGKSPPNLFKVFPLRSEAVVGIETWRPCCRVSR